jgi:hypothetical protein
MWQPLRSISSNIRWKRPSSERSFIALFPRPDQLPLSIPLETWRWASLRDNDGTRLFDEVDDNRRQWSDAGNAYDNLHRCMNTGVDAL